MRIGVLGTGVVGARVARELSSSVGVTAFLMSGSMSRQRELAGALGPSVMTMSADYAPSIDLDAVVLTTPDDTQPDLAKVQLESGRHVVTTASSLESVERLLELDTLARSAGRRVVVGASFSPGCSTTLAIHAAELFEHVLEVRTASAGWGGAACESDVRSLLRRSGREWRDGAWHEVRGGGSKELLWFPDPIGARECGTGAHGEPLLLRRVLPSATRLVTRGSVVAHSVKRPRTWSRGPKLDDPGAIRVEVRGVRDGVTESVIYGAMERPSTATAVVAAVAAIGVGESGGDGAVAVPQVDSPVALLREWARRGLRIGVFEGSLG